MTLFREVVIEWEGEEYSFVPTMQLLSFLERDGVSLVALNMAAMRGEPQVATMASVLGKIMRHLEIDISDEALYSDMVHNESEAVMLWRTISEGFFPEKREAPKKPAKKQTGKGKSRKASA